MTQLLNGVPQAFAGGTYNYKAKLTTGIAKLQYQVAEEGFDDIASSEVTADTGVNFEIPVGEVQAVITGDGEVWLTKVQVSLE